MNTTFGSQKPAFKVSAIALLAMAFPFTLPAHAALQGDEAAIALADEMVTAMGGHEIWATAHWMYAEERSFSGRQKLGLDYKGWRDFRTPRGKHQVVSPEISYKQSWTTEGGWRVLDGEYQEFDADRLAGEVNFWPREIYTMYHRFAAGDETLRLTHEGERKFSIEDAQTAAPLGSFTVSLEGGPVIWSSGDTDEDVTYVYGPLKAFGPIKMPAWGGQTSGGWRFNYVDAKLFHEAPPADLFTSSRPGE